MLSNEASRERDDAPTWLTMYSSSIALERREAGKRLELAVEADDRRAADLQVDVARTAVDGGAEDPLEIDVVHRGVASCG